MTRFKYSVSFWDDTDNRKRNAYGYVYVADASDAIASLHKYYGEENINRYYIEPDCSDSLIELGYNEKFTVDWKGLAVNEGF